MSTHRPTLLLLSLPAAAQVPETKILGEAREHQPGYSEIENFRVLSYSDLDGWDRAAEFRISRDGKVAYTTNYQGASIVDVSDAEKPRVVSRITNEPGVQSQYIDVLGNILVINQERLRDAPPDKGDPRTRLIRSRPIG